MESVALGLIATALGGGLTLAATWLTQAYSARREEAQWRRQREAEREDRVQEEQQRAKIELRELYAETIYHLSAMQIFLNRRDANTQSTVEENEHFREAHRCLSALMTHVKPNFVDQYEAGMLEDFMSGHEVGLGHAQETIRRLAEHDPRVESVTVDLPPHPRREKS